MKYQMKHRTPPYRDSCSWVAALSDKEIRDTQMRDLDKCTLSKLKIEDYNSTELDLPLSSKTVKHFWNCSSQLKVLDGMYHFL